MSDSVRPHRQKSTRLPRPWDSPGKNTGVGCHFLLQCRKVKSEREVTQSCPTLSDPMDCSLPGSSVHGIFQPRVLEWGAIAFSVWVCVNSRSWSWTRKTGILQFMGSQRVRHDWATALNLNAICVPDFRLVKFKIKLCHSRLMFIKFYIIYLVT